LAALRAAGYGNTGLPTDLKEQKPTKTFGPLPVLFMKNIESEIYKYLVERGWDKLRPSDLAKSICIEAAELLEIFQWTSLNIEETKQDSKKMKEIKKELADVFIYAFEMAILLDLDTKKIIREKLKLVKKKYPAELMRRNSRKESGSGTDSVYWKIKNRHRRNRKS
jgi:NTP pyrophosphatase (non-canonical NTP hydrolase)